MTNILITGGAGQLGQAFTAHAPELQKQGLSLIVLARHQLDITHQDSVRNAFHNYRPDVVINAAAYTNVE
ncbi:MAG TPA: sugar nucleotide-binding protein, partial [Oligella sp.]|nr:sugar nucleotide-binding protein [Oligella sp.]